jgi:hypothetical protein
VRAAGCSIRRVRILLVLAAALVLAPAAAAKGPFQVCGASGCTELGPETQFPLRLTVAPSTQTLSTAAPAPYFTVRWGHGVVAFWVPSSGALLLGQPPAWVAPLESELAVLRARTAGMAPFAPPKYAVAYVDWERVKNGDGYLRLMTIGRPVAAAPAPTRWVDVLVMGGISPWNDGSISLSISRSGYLKRDGHVYRITPALARRVLARLPLG